MPTAHDGPDGAEIVDRMYLALAGLLRTRLVAESVSAVAAEYTSLQAAGLSDEDLEWLLQADICEHWLERRLKEGFACSSRPRTAGSAPIRASCCRRTVSSVPVP